MPDMGNEEITGFNHFSVCFGDGESGMNGRIKRIEGFIKVIRRERICAGMIGLNVDEADMRVRCFGFFEGAKGEAVERAVVSGEEFGYAVFGDMALDGGEEIGVEGGGGIGVTEEEARFLRHKMHFLLIHFLH